MKLCRSPFSLKTLLAATSSFLEPASQTESETLPEATREQLEVVSQDGTPRSPPPEASKQLRHTARGFSSAGSEQSMQAVLARRTHATRHAAVSSRQCTLFLLQDGPKMANAAWTVVSAVAFADSFQQRHWLRHGH